MSENPYESPKVVSEKRTDARIASPQVIGTIFLVPLALLVAIAFIAGAFIAARLIVE